MNSCVFIVASLDTIVQHAPRNQRPKHLRWGGLLFSPVSLLLSNYTLLMMVVLSALVDSGATVNLIDQHLFEDCVYP